jgi:small-conductance mechanosensitive channel
MQNIETKHNREYQMQHDNHLHAGTAPAPLRHHWPLVSTLGLLTAIPAIPAAIILLLLLLAPTESTLFVALVNPHYLTSPWAIWVHGSSGVLFFLAMPWQFSPKFRLKRPAWHRVSGRLTLISAYVMAVSGVWMHLSLTPDERGMRFIGLLVLSGAMIVAFSLAFYAVLQRQFEQHRRWMYRAVAITLAAVTPLFIEATAELTLGQLALFKPLLTPFFYDYSRFLGMLINLLIAQWLLRLPVTSPKTALA